MMSGLTPAWSAANSSPVRPNPVVPPADLPQVGQIARIVEAHPPCALDDRLDDDGRQFVGVVGQLRLERRHVGGVIVARNLGGEHLPGQDVGPQRVHAAVGIADAHRGERVAVIAAAPGHQPVFVGPAAAAPVLQCHLYRDLHRHRSGVAEEHRFQPCWRDVDQQLRQSRSRLVGQPAEHDVVHRRQLPRHRRVEDRVTVPVDGGPPRAHCVEYLDGLTVVNQCQPGATGTDRDHRGHCLGADRAVGVPEMRRVDRADLLGREPGSRRGHNERG
jgi:hypothetical protein